jgi:hypothetical protein
VPALIVCSYTAGIAAQHGIEPASLELQPGSLCHLLGDAVASQQDAIILDGMELMDNARSVVLLPGVSLSIICRFMSG